MRLIWIRHGETDWNQKKCYLGHLDVPLNQTGKRQVLATAEKLKNLIYQTNHNKILLFSSDLTRCVETAKILNEELFHSKLQLDTSRSLRELNFGDWEGKTYLEIMQTDPEPLQKWYGNILNEAPPNGESLAQLGIRLDSFLIDLINSADPDTTILLVSHGGIIRWFQSSWILKDINQFWQVKQIPNAGVLTFDLGV